MIGSRPDKQIVYAHCVAEKSSGGAEQKTALAPSFTRAALAAALSP